MSVLGKILIIDDNPKLLEDALPMYGYEVKTATDGLLGLKILSEEKVPFDLILLDVVMPNLDGWETLKAIRESEKTKHTPIIMLTAVNEENKQVSGLKFGADDYITKPFILPNLLARIEALLRRSNWSNEKKHAAALPFVSSEPISPLTSREKEILTLVAKGESNADIAKKLFVSAKTGQRLNQIFDTAREVAFERAKRISTGLLNKVVNEAFALNPPVAIKGKMLRVYYTTQPKTKPPTFVLFINNKDLVKDSYKRYLLKKLRDAFGFFGTPIRISFREKGEK